MAGAKGEFTFSDSSPDRSTSGNSSNAARASGFFQAVAFIVTLFHPIIQLFSQVPRQDDGDRTNNKNNNANTTTKGQDNSRKMQQSPSTADPNGGSTTTAIMNGNGNTTTVADGGGRGALDDMTNGAPMDRQVADAVDRIKLEDNKDKLEQTKHNEDVAGELTLPPPEEPKDEESEDPVVAAERKIHTGFMNQALDMARLALKTNETPVGCVLVHDGRVIAKGMNATNVTRNGTRHAELMALTALLSYTPNSDIEKEVEKPKKSKRSKNRGDQQPTAPSFTDQDWGDVDPKDGHIFPYGQKLHPAPRVDKNLIKDCTLYVTVEPCVMCASMLRQYGIRKVYFGAVNDKFGGTGGVFCIHMNSDPADSVTAPPSPTARPAKGQIHRPLLAHKSASCTPKINVTNTRPADNEENKDEIKDESNDGKEKIPARIAPPPIPMSNISVGHGGNVEDGFEAEGGWGRDDAVNLLRQFYVQENGRAPQPRKKEGRAARLAAMMEDQGMSVEGTPLAGMSIAGGSDAELGNSDMPSPVPGHDGAADQDADEFDEARTPQLLANEITAA